MGKGKKWESITGFKNKEIGKKQGKKERDEKRT